MKNIRKLLKKLQLKDLLLKNSFYLLFFNFLIFNNKDINLVLFRF